MKHRPIAPKLTSDLASRSPKRCCEEPWSDSARASGLEAQSLLLQENFPIPGQRATSKATHCKIGKSSDRSTNYPTKDQLTRSRKTNRKPQRTFCERKENIIRNLESRICVLESNETSILQKVLAERDLALQEVERLKQRLAAVEAPEIHKVEIQAEQNAWDPDFFVEATAPLKRDDCLVVDATQAWLFSKAKHEHVPRNLSRQHLRAEYMHLPMQHVTQIPHSDIPHGRIPLDHREQESGRSCSHASHDLMEVKSGNPKGISKERLKLDFILLK